MAHRVHCESVRHLPKPSADSEGGRNRGERCVKSDLTRAVPAGHRSEPLRAGDALHPRPSFHTPLTQTMHSTHVLEHLYHGSHAVQVTPRLPVAPQRHA